MRFWFYCFWEKVRQFASFLTKIKSFYKLWCDYEYDGAVVEHIIDTYTQVLCNRTKLMSKPTYYLSAVLDEIDKWYEDMYENDWKTCYDKEPIEKMEKSE